MQNSNFLGSATFFSATKEKKQKIHKLVNPITFLSFWRIAETAERRETASSRRRRTSRVARGTRRRAAAPCSSSEAAISSETIWSFDSSSARCSSTESCECRLWVAAFIHFFGSKLSLENGPRSSIMLTLLRRVSGGGFYGWGRERWRLGPKIIWRFSLIYYWYVW